MKRTPLKRGTGLKRTPIHRKSKTDPISDLVNTQVQLRSGGLCEARLSPECKHYGVHRHHRKLRRSGDHWAVNLLLVCLPCHAAIHAHPSLAYERGFLVHMTDDPANIPVLTGIQGI